MKKERRLVYLALSDVPIPWPRVEGMSKPYESCLCMFCRLADWQGECDESYPICQHSRAEELAGYAEPPGWIPGDDCRGFVARARVATVANFVGQRLQGQLVNLA